MSSVNVLSVTRVAVNQIIQAFLGIPSREEMSVSKRLVFMNRSFFAVEGQLYYCSTGTNSSQEGMLFPAKQLVYRAVRRSEQHGKFAYIEKEDGQNKALYLTTLLMYEVQPGREEPLHKSYDDVDGAIRRVGSVLYRFAENMDAPDGQLHTSFCFGRCTFWDEPEPLVQALIDRLGFDKALKGTLALPPVDAAFQARVDALLNDPDIPDETVDSTKDKKLVELVAPWIERQMESTL